MPKYENMDDVVVKVKAFEDRFFVRVRIGILRL